MPSLVLPKLVLPAQAVALATPRGQVPATVVRQKPPKRIPPEYEGDPVHLSSAVSNLQPGAGGVGVNIKALVNPGPGPMEVHGIKFRIRSASYAPSGAMIACRLDLGEFGLTNGFVPVFAFGRAENALGEQVTAAPGSAISYAYAQYVARLSRPIYLPVGAAIRPQLMHKGQATTPADVNVSVFGRMLSPRSPLPTVLKLPYWTSYVSKSFALGTPDQETSSESDLYNPFDTDLELERFVGRVNFTSDAGFAYGSLMTEMESSPYALQTGGLLSYLGDSIGQLLLTMTDSDGFPVVKRPAPFRLVFDHLTRSWPLSHTLPPRGYYHVELYNQAPLYGAAPYPVNMQATIAMMGWREIS